MNYSGLTSHRLSAPSFALAILAAAVAVKPAHAASRYWVGTAGGSWSADSNWSATSGGAGGASAPTGGDDVILDGANVNSAVVDASFGGSVASVLITNYTGTITQNRDLSVGGAFRFYRGVWQYSAGTPAKLDVGNDWYVASTVVCHYASLIGNGTGRVFTVGGSLTVAAKGAIHADALGFPNGGVAGGPGPSAPLPEGAGGGSGGYGGQGASTPAGVNGGKAYGSITNPIALGGGGATGGAGYGGYGGGAIQLVVTGTATVDGRISADAKTFLLPHKGGGAGGSILLRCATLAGSGTLRANGSVGSTGAYSRGGGGGRMALFYSTKTFTGAMQAFGYIGFGGGAGTIYLKTPAQTYGELIVDNNDFGTQPFKSTLTSLSDVQSVSCRFDSVVLRKQGALFIGPDDTLTVNSLTNITGDASGWLVNAGSLNYGGTLVTNWNYTFSYADRGGSGLNLSSAPTFSRCTFVKGTNGVHLVNAVVTVATNGTLAIDGPHTLPSLTVKGGGKLTHSMNLRRQEFVLDLTVTGDLMIENNGAIDVTACGLIPMYGAGRGLSLFHSGGYGGQPDPYGTDRIAATYGSVTNPLDIGSGGGSGDEVAGGSGGGLVKLNVLGTLTVNGSILANGLWRVQPWHGSGSGGSVFIRANDLAGGGAIRANAAPAWSGVYSRGGGGGRIAVVYGSSTFSGVMTAYGGAYSTDASGAAGTVYVKIASQTHGALTIDNHNQAAPDAVTMIWTNVRDKVVGNVTIRNGARVMLSTNDTLRVNGSWTNLATFTAASNSTVVFASAGEATVNNRNTFYHLTATNSGKTLSFQAGQTNVVQGRLRLRNATVKSTVNNFWWHLNVTGPNATNDVDGCAVRDSHAGGGQQIHGHLSQSLGNNVNWIFTPRGTVVLVH